MATIFYSMSGEGRGHAARARALVERLKFQHRVVLFAPDQAYDFLASFYRRDEAVDLRRLRGLRFCYHRGKLNLTQSLAAGWRYHRDLPYLVDDLTRTIDREQPQLAITDFEPALPRAAEQCGLPYVGFSHQAALAACRLHGLPLRLRWFLGSMSLLTRLFHHREAALVATAFFDAPLKRGYANRTTLVGPILRDDILRAEPQAGDYLVSYLRPHTPPAVFDALYDLGRRVRIYGQGARAADGLLEFRPFDTKQFVEDLAGCAAYLGAAGNQSLGEALYLGKPILALPEEKHYEQRVNAHFVQQMRVGEFALLEEASVQHMRLFLSRLDHFQRRAALYQGQRDGTSAALNAIERCLSPQPVKALASAA